MALSLVGGALAAPQATAEGPVAAPVEPKFDIWEYEIEGNGVLSVAAIEAAVTPFLGPDRDMKAVEAARAALEAAYQRAGYLTALVDVPEQRVDGGVVRLAVLEGRVGGLYVTGSRYHDQGYIRAAVPSLKPGAVPDFNRVQAELDTLNRGEDRRVQPVLKPGLRAGEVDVELQVRDERPISGSLELNNQHGRDTDPYRLVATLRHANVGQRDHSASLMLQTAPRAPSQSKVAVFSYSVPQDDGGAWTGSITGSGSDIETLGGAQVLGNGTTWGLRRSLPVGDHGSLSWGLDYKDLRERTRFGEDGFSTPLRYLPLQAAWSDFWALGSQRLQWTLTGVAAVGALLKREVDCPLADGTLGRADQFACKREGADGSFALIRADLQWAQPWLWGSASWRLVGQFTSQPLVSAEQMSLGGADSVRGYLDGEASGDHGVRGSWEWRSPSLAPRLGGPWRDLALVSFAEVGRVEIEQPSAGQAARVPLAGAGLGLRFALGGPAGTSAEGGLDLAWPLKRTDNVSELDPRWHARLLARF